MKWGAPKWPPKPPSVRSAPAQPGRSSESHTLGAPRRSGAPRFRGRFAVVALSILMMDPVRAAFDRIAEQYAADFADELARKPWDVERLRRFAAACPPGPVLDVGCGAAGHI